MDVSPGHHKRGTPLDKDGQQVKKTTRGWVYTCSELDFLRTVPYHYNAWSNSVLERYFFHPCVISLLYKGLGSHLNRFYSHLALHVPRTVPPALLSVLGLVCSCIAAATTIWHTSTPSGLVPSWVFYLDAACVMYCIRSSVLLMSVSNHMYQVVPRFRCLGRQTIIQDPKFRD